MRAGQRGGERCSRRNAASRQPERRPMSRSTTSVDLYVVWIGEASGQWRLCPPPLSTIRWFRRSGSARCMVMAFAGLVSLSDRRSGSASRQDARQPGPRRRTVGGVTGGDMRRLIYMLPVPLVRALGSGSPWGDPRPDRVPSALIDKPAPEFSLPPLPGAATGFLLRRPQGQGQLVNVFASWCAPCRTEHPY